MKHLFALPLICAGPAFAACPPPPDIQAAEDRLLSEVRVAPNERAARELSNNLWELWTMAPDDAAQDLLDKGMQARSSFDFVLAVSSFDALTEYCPDYAEGYNQRAFVNFLREDYEAALIDLDLALERSPQHVGALSGKALSLIGLERQAEAQDVLRDALKLNPWLSERHLLIEPGGEDL
ncbi:hypothetical protein N9L47_13315 [Rhodobacteraceae bacterium]|nr:hypothetical protein [Paracoccaceae bacterium]